MDDDPFLKQTSDTNSHEQISAEQQVAHAITGLSDYFHELARRQHVHPIGVTPEIPRGDGFIGPLYGNRSDMSVAGNFNCVISYYSGRDMQIFKLESAEPVYKILVRDAPGEKRHAASDTDYDELLVVLSKVTEDVAMAKEAAAEAGKKTGRTILKRLFHIAI